MTDESSLKINAVDFSDIFYPDQNFEALTPLGKPNEIKYKESYIEETWIREYKGLILKYTNINGYPELYEMDLEGDQFKVTIDSLRFKVSDNINLLSKGMDLNENFILNNEGFNEDSFLKIFTSTEGEIKRISYKSLD